MLQSASPGKPLCFHGGNEGAFHWGSRGEKGLQRSLFGSEILKRGASDPGDPVLRRRFQHQGDRTNPGDYRRGGTEAAFSGQDAVERQTYANGGTHMRLEEIKKELPETPDFIHRMILEEVENQLGEENNTAVHIKESQRRRRKWGPARVAAVAALCVLGFSTVAYAGYQLYTMYVEKQGKYGISAGITMEKGTASLIVPHEIPQVKIQPGYIPEGMEWADDASGKTRLFYSETPYLGGISIGTVLLDSDDTDQILTETGVIESEKRTFGSREGIYLRFQDLEQDKTFNQVIYLLCPEEYQVVIMNIGDDVTKEDAVKFAENLSVKLGCKILMSDQRDVFKNAIKLDKPLSPEQFIRAIMSAQYVVTNSFHGMVLSINLKQRARIFIPETAPARITDILDNFKLNRLCQDELLSLEEIKSLYSYANKKINEGRLSARKYLLSLSEL